jgi:ubiquinone/menaquinone biosynthesis C-methylase UbiE
MSVATEHFDYRLSHLAAGKADRYDLSFIADPWRAYLWRGEQDVLARVLRRHFPDAPANHLDFACGTGRILSFLRRRVGRSVGVDVSAEMLGLAAAKVPHVRLVRADITRSDVLGDETFDLITAFRFLANAQEQLRVKALRALARHLSPRGRLVLNNHKNRSSLLYRLGRLMNKHTRTLSHRHLCQLLRQAGLEIIQAYPLGILPATDTHMLLPAWAHRAVDAALARGPLGIDLAQDIIYVCAPRDDGKPCQRRRSGGPS